MMMCYDQLNLPALASAEALNRRRTLIEHAHQGRPEAPSYEGAEDFLGVRESSDGSIIDPALAQHAARRQAAKAEVMKQTRLAAEEKRLVKKGDGKGGKDGAAKEAATKPWGCSPPCQLWCCWQGGSGWTHHEVFQRSSGKVGWSFSSSASWRWGLRGELAALASRRSKQRVGRRRLLLDREMETVRCLNCLAGFEDEKLWPMQTLNFAQKSVLGHVRRAHSERAPPTSSESCQAALRQLLKKKAPSVYEAEGSPGQVVSFVRSKVSLPKGQHDPVSLLGVLPALERSQLMNFESEMLLSEEERAAVLEKGLEGDMYLDPVLSNNTQAYHGFIADLFSCNILGFTSRPKMQVGAFFVSKKNGKQRLVIDARRANRLFRTPPSTCLGSVDCYGRLEVEPGSTVFMAQEDVKDYFYRLGIEPSLGDYFALPKINVLKLREELGSLPPEVIRLVDQHDGDIYPCLKVLRMGFNWAFHLAHQAHCHLASMAVPKAPILLDRRAAPRLGTLKGSVASSMLIYADNNNHIGVESSVVNRDQQVMLEELHKHGLDTSWGDGSQHLDWKPWCSGQWFGGPGHNHAHQRLEVG